MLKNIWQNRKSWTGYFSIILALHILGILGLVSAASQHPGFFGLGLLAYSLGLRHAFDVDHIAAIDNTVRKFVQQSKNPHGVGFYFSLGHSTVVFIMVAVIAFSVQWIQAQWPFMQEFGGVIGTAVSGTFLMIIGFLNLLILLNLIQVFRNMVRSGKQSEDMEQLLNSRGLLARIILPLFRLIGRSSHMYPLGFLFGLGFDTVTEVGLLAMSAGTANGSVSVFGILSLPILFAAGMCLMDTADGIFMTTAYHWAFATPLKKMYYNLTVTTVSVIAALCIGSLQLSQVLAEKLLPNSWIQGLDLGGFGFLLVSFFLAAWGISVALWKANNPRGKMSSKVH